MTKARAQRIAYAVHDGTRANAQLHHAAFAGDAAAVVDLLRAEARAARQEGGGVRWGGMGEGRARVWGGGACTGVRGGRARWCVREYARAPLARLMQPTVLPHSTPTTPVLRPQVTWPSPRPRLQRASSPPSTRSPPPRTSPTAAPARPPHSAPPQDVMQLAVAVAAAATALNEAPPPPQPAHPGAHATGSPHHLVASGSPTGAHAAMSRTGSPTDTHAQWAAPPPPAHPSVHAPNAAGEAPLARAARSAAPALAVMQHLLAAGAAAGAVCARGRTALHEAAAGGGARVGEVCARVALLLAARADPNARDHEGRTALHEVRVCVCGNMCGKPRVWRREHWCVRAW